MPRLLFAVACKHTLIALKELSSGEADASTICSLSLETVTDYGLEIKCIAVFGSDGASVMTGKHAYWCRS